MIDSAPEFDHYSVKSIPLDDEWGVACYTGTAVGNIGRDHWYVYHACGSLGDSNNQICFNCKKSIPDTVRGFRALCENKNIGS